MLEAAQVVGCLAAVLLVMAVAAFAGLGRDRRCSGSTVGEEPLSRQSELPGQLLMSAFGLSALAAALAILNSNTSEARTRRR